MGLPVVASPLAARGVRAEAGVHLEVADGAVAFAGHVTRLLKQPEARRDLGGAGRACVEAHYTWERNLSGLEALVVGAGGRPQQAEHAAGSPAHRARAWSPRS